MIGALGFGLLAFTPGAWLAFGLPLGGLPFWARLMLGVVLSPLVTALEFYVLRLLGAPFEVAVPLLVVLNLPALLLVARHFERPDLSDRRTLWAGGVVALITVLSFGPRLTDEQDRVYTGHSWVHADIAYALADGELRPEEPLLAGVRLAYPWAGTIQLAAMSWLVDRPLVTNHQWISLLWLIPIAAFALGIAGVLGARGVAKVAAVPWLFFGVNAIGSTAMAVLPKETIRALPIWGDARYTPWVFKFFFPNAMPFALGIFIALAYLMVRQESVARAAWARHVLVLILLVGVGVLYPILAPAALALVGARLLAELVAQGLGRRALRALLGDVLVLALAVALTYGHLRFVTVDRVAGAIELSPPNEVGLKALVGLVVSLPLLAGLLWCLRRLWRERRTATLVLAVAGAASLALHAVVSLPNWVNEYKYIYTAAMCLAPFPALAIEGLLRRAGRAATAWLAVLTLALATPMAAKAYLHRNWGSPPWGHGGQGAPTHRPIADVSRFDLRLVASERAAAMCAAIRAKTPADTLLVTQGVGLHLPTLTHRHLYLPADEPALFGVNRSGDYLLRLWRGYDPELLDERGRVTASLFGDDAQARRDALERIGALQRPVAIVLEVEPGVRYAQMPEREKAPRRAADRQMLEWLRASGLGRSIYEGEGYVVWLVE